VDDCDEGFVNGQPVGKTCGWDTPRAYTLPAGLLREGDNLVAVRVTDHRRRRLPWRAGPAAPGHRRWHHRPWRAVAGPRRVAAPSRSPAPTTCPACCSTAWSAPSRLWRCAASSGTRARPTRRARALCAGLPAPHRGLARAMARAGAPG
jgi:hypothetical protein